MGSAKMWRSSVLNYCERTNIEKNRDGWMGGWLGGWRKARVDMSGWIDGVMKTHICISCFPHTIFYTISYYTLCEGFEATIDFFLYELKTLYKQFQV